HCIDAWSYLGRAVGAMLRGDADAARHLAYYAELRAALSILARSGIAVLNGRHFILDSNGHAVNFSNEDFTSNRIPSTHVAAWVVLQRWAQSPSAAALLADVIRPESVPLRNWLEQIPNLSTWSSLAPRWLQEFGADVRRFGYDR